MKLVRLLNELNTSKLLREAVEMFGDVPVLVNPDANEVQALLDNVSPTRIKVDLKGLWDPRGKVYIWDGGDEVDDSRHHITITLGIIERYGHPDSEDFYNAFGDDIEDNLIKSFEEDAMLIPSIIEYRKSWPGQQWTGQKYTAQPENPLLVTNPYNVWTASDIILKTPEMQRAFGGPLKESVLTEAREADLYHWMFSDRADMILQEDKLPGEWEHVMPYTNKTIKGTSMSRNPYFYLGRPIRLVFDQDKLAQTHKIIPLDAEKTYQYTANYDPAKWGDPEDDEEGYDWRSTFDRNKRLRTLMAEEFVIGDIAPLHKYLKRIEVVNSFVQYANKREQILLDEITHYSKQFGIQVTSTPGGFQAHHPKMQQWLSSKEPPLLHEFDIGDFKGGGDDGDKSYETPYIEHYKKVLVMKLWKGSWTFAANPKGAEMMGSAIADAGFYFSNNIEFAPGVSQELRNRIEFGWGERLEDKNYEVWGLDDRPVDKEERYQLIFGNKPGSTPDWEGMSGVREDITPRRKQEYEWLFMCGLCMHLAWLINKKLGLPIAGIEVENAIGARTLTHGWIEVGDYAIDIEGLKDKDETVSKYMAGARTQGHDDPQYVQNVNPRMIANQIRMGFYGGHSGPKKMDREWLKAAYRSAVDIIEPLLKEKGLVEKQELDEISMSSDGQVDVFGDTFLQNRIKIAKGNAAHSQVLGIVGSHQLVTTGDLMSDFNDEEVELLLQSMSGEYDGYISLKRYSNRKDVYTVDTIMLDHDVRGTGLAVELYEWFLNNGISLVSDQEHTPGSQQIWNTLWQKRPVYLLDKESKKSERVHSHDDFERAYSDRKYLLLAKAGDMS